MKIKLLGKNIIDIQDTVYHYKNVKKMIESLFTA